MRKTNSTRKVILIFFIGLMLVSMMSCKNNENPNENISTTNMSWNELIEVDIDNIAKVDISSYVVPSMTSSIATKAQIISVNDTEKINSLIDIIENKKIDFEIFPTEMEKISEYNSSRTGKNVYKIVFKDTNNRDVFALCLYEDNSANILESKTLNSGKETLVYTYNIFFEDNIYELIENYYETIQSWKEIFYEKKALCQ